MSTLCARGGCQLVAIALSQWRQLHKFYINYVFNLFFYFKMGDNNFLSNNSYFCDCIKGVL